MLAYAEVYEILNILEEEYVEKIPKKIVDFFEKERIKEYKPDIKANVPLIDQNLKRETFVLLAILNLNYWCNSQEEKREFLNKLNENEKAMRTLIEKNNSDNMFEGRGNNDSNNVQVVDISNYLPIKYENQSLFKNIVDNIRGFFKKK